MTTHTSPLAQQVLGDVGKNWGWFLALGILFIIFGFVALGMSTLLTVTTVMVFGVMILVGGGVQIVEAFQCKGWKGIILHILIGLLYVAAGVMLVARPMQGALALTLFLGWMILMAGVFRIIMGIQLKSAGGRGWVIFSGVVSILLGIMILAKWPASGLKIIGLVVAIEMIMHGWGYIAIAIAAKAARNVVKEALPENPSTVG